MIKGDTALDMRGRCSAGQKVCALALNISLFGSFGVKNVFEPRPQGEILKPISLWYS